MSSMAGRNARTNSVRRRPNSGTPPGMANTLVVCGYGPGISRAVARRFGAEGFQVALVARRAEPLQSAAAELNAAGVRAKAFARDLGNFAAVTDLIAQVRAELGPITVLHWNPFSHAAGDIARCEPAELRSVFDLAVTNLVGATQAALPDLRSAAGQAGVLVTGGGYALYDPAIDAMAVKYGGMGLSVAKAAQHKLVGVLNAQLAPEGIYVGEVTVLGLVKGTAFDRGNATIAPEAVAEKFWTIYRERSAPYAQVM